MILKLRYLLILLLVVALPWPGGAMMATESVAVKVDQAVESHPCHDPDDHSAAALQSATDSSLPRESCAAGHVGKCCVGCQAHSLPAVLPPIFQQSGFTPYPALVERWSGFIPDQPHRPPR